MEQFLVPSSPQRNPSSSTSGSASTNRFRWTRCTGELEGRITPQFRHQASQLLLHSYSQTGTFEHNSNDGDGICHTTMSQSFSDILPTSFNSREGVSALEFDAKGVYVASVTKSGCLSVHDFETLYCTIHGPSSSTTKCTGKPLVHIPTAMPLSAIRWNPSNQDEVACASRQREGIFLFDISYVSAEPIEVLVKGKSKFSGLSSAGQHGFSDIVFPSEDKSRLLASSLNGGIYMWDRRVRTTHCLELFTKSSQCQFNSIELDTEDRVVFGAGGNGVIYAWDLRGGRSSFAFQSTNEVPLLTSMKVSSMLEKIKPLKEQANIVSRGIHAINFDPSCSYQLAFHLDDGWSGVINLNDLDVTHVHCPPPNWLVMDSLTFTDVRRPAWLPSLSVYAVGSSSKGIYLLDFYPDTTSASHIYFKDESHETESTTGEKKRLMQNMLINTSEDVISCTVHPFNGTIIAGTRESSLLVVSQNPSNEDGE